MGGGGSEQDQFPQLMTVTLQCSHFSTTIKVQFFTFIQTQS